MEVENREDTNTPPKNKEDKQIMEDLLYGLVAQLFYMVLLLAGFEKESRTCI